MRRTTISVVLAAFVGSVGATLAASGEDGEAASQAAPKLEVAAVPGTAEEHLTRAAAYKDKAAQYRKEAEEHRKMFADYKAQQNLPALQTKTGRELPWIAKMRKHCESYMKQAERMAAEAERFAEFHRMRGEEMQGK